MTSRSLAVLPVYNEVGHVDSVLNEVKQYIDEVVVVDDGSTDGTAERLGRRSDVIVLTHEVNQGYGAALRTAFDYAIAEDYCGVVTIDSDGQHQPRRITQFLAGLESADIVSGSRYLQQFEGDSAPPGQRMQINRQITAELNRTLGLQLTDAFCGFKAYRVDALRKLKLTEPGYAMPLELWVQAARAGLRIVEMPTPLIYLDESRSFGGALDDGETRLKYYQSILRDALRKTPSAKPASVDRPLQGTAAGDAGGVSRLADEAPRPTRRCNTR